MRIDMSRGTFEEVVQSCPPPMAVIAYKLRKIIAEVYPNVVEVPRPAEQHASYGIGPNKTSEIFGYICPMQAYVRLGFYYGGLLPDPNRLLIGTGKRLRHIKIASIAEAVQPSIRQLLAAAILERKKAFGME